MSRVYYYPEIQSYIPPGPEQFVEEVGQLRRGLADLYDDELISGAFIYGSAVFGAANPRSDVDVLIATKELTGGLRESVHRISRLMHQRSSIPLDVSCFTEDDLTSGRHDYYMINILEWLKQQTELFPDNIIGRNPVELIQPLDVDPLQAVLDNLARQKHTLEMTYMKGVYKDPVALLEMILNLPHKMGRGAMDALELHDCVPRGSMPDVRKSTIADAIASTIGVDDPAIVELYGELAADFSLYTEFVNEVGVKGIDNGEYDQVVEATVADDLPKAIELIARVQDAVVNRVGSSFLEVS